MSTPVQCGTAAGYRAHKRSKEHPCPPCCTAHSDQKRAYQIRANHDHRVTVPAWLLARALPALPERVVRELEAQIGPCTVAAVAALHVAEEVASG